MNLELVLHQGASGQKLLADLATFQFVPMPDALWITAGDHLAALRRNGITVPLADAVVATLGIENDIEVWARDPHFPMMLTFCHGSNSSRSHRE